MKKDKGIFDDDDIGDDTAARERRAAQQPSAWSQFDGGSISIMTGA